MALTHHWRSTADVLVTSLIVNNMINRYGNMIQKDEMDCGHMDFVFERRVKDFHLRKCGAG